MNLRVQTLTILERVEGGMPLTALRAELRVVYNRRAGDGDLESVLSELKADKHIKESTHEITGDRLFTFIPKRRRK